jgi:hypothetical protein
VNGQKVSSSTRITLGSEDSIYVLVQAKISGLPSPLPYLISDSILFYTQGVNTPAKVILEAFGQEVNLFQDTVLSCNQVWNDKQKPYFVRNSLLVPKGCSLTIGPGVKIFNFKNSVFFVQGTLIVQGTKTQKVLYTGTRQEPDYDDQPGQWSAIVFLDSSSGNSIDYAVIKNADYGVQVGFPGNVKPPDVSISNTQISNHSFSGIYCFGANVLAWNNLITDCGTYSFGAFRGGLYQLIHNTFTYSGNFGFSRRTPTVAFTDFYEETGKSYPDKKLEIRLYNNLINGAQIDELRWVQTRSDNTFGIEGNAIKASWDQIPRTRNQLAPREIRLANPLFFNFRYGRDSIYLLKKGLPPSSPVFGTFSALIATDIDGTSRPINDSADIGCYQKIR